MRIIKFTTATMAVFLLALVVQATPKVGDRLIVKSEIEDADGITEGLTRKIELAEYDKERDMFLERIKIMLPNGRIVVSETWTAAKEFPTTQQIMDIISKCVEKGGEKVMVKIKDSNVETCHLKNDENLTEAWIADMLYGAAKVKMTNQDGSFEHLTVLEYVNAK